MRKLAFVFVVASLLVALAVPAMAGPFSDVPANSWAYKAVQDLAAKGLVIGYGDSTFRGDRLATRYEMAMVVARMLDMYEKGQNAQDQKIQLNANDIATLMKLAEEFKSELASLNVRVAALEKKAALDTVNFTGDAQFRLNTANQDYYALSPLKTNTYTVTQDEYDYNTSTNGGIIGTVSPSMTNAGDPGLQNTRNSTYMKYRIRLNIAAPIADNISFNGRLVVEKNAGDNTAGGSNNPILAATSGYMDNSNTLFVDRSYITWTLNPYPITFVLGRLPTMDQGQYYNNMFLDEGTEGGQVIFDMSNFLPSTTVSATWAKLFDDGSITSTQEANGYKDKDMYILNLKTKIFNAFNLEADYGYVDKLAYYGGLSAGTGLSGLNGITSTNSALTTGNNGQYGKYDWWLVLGSWNVYGIDMYAGYEGTSTDMPVLDGSGNINGINSVNGGAWGLGGDMPLLVGTLGTDLWLGNNKWYNPFINNTVSTGYKDYFDVYYLIPVAKNAHLSLVYLYQKGQKPYNTDATNGYYYTFNPAQANNYNEFEFELNVNF